MRDKVNVLYYPDMIAGPATLKKAMLFFDEIHFMDRPSFTFENGFGSVGCDSPFRQVEQSFRDKGVPLFVHKPVDGPVEGGFHDKVSADLNDPEFLARFQTGLERSQTFRSLIVSPGNYGAVGTHEDVAAALSAVDLKAAMGGYRKPMDLFADKTVRPFDFSTPLATAKTFLCNAASCSAKLNFAMNVGAKYGFVPLADATPYGDLLGAQYARAIAAAKPTKTNIQITDLSFALFDELVSPERLEKLTLPQIANYRKASEAARNDFLEQLALIQAKQAAIGSDGDYSGAVSKIVKTEILPAAKTFRDKLKTIEESMHGALAKGTITYLGAGSAINFFGDLSWEKLIALSGIAAAYVGTAAIDGLLSQRAAKRECALSYILSLDG